MKDVNTYKLLLASFLIKLSYLIISFIIFQNASVLSVRGYSNIIKRNDSGWYEKIALSGYGPVSDKIDLGYSHGPDIKQSEWAFFPLYPLLIHACMKLFNIGFDISGLILSLVFASAALIGFYFFCKSYFINSAMAYYCCVLFLVFPFHYYYSMMYTEALFFTFLIFTFLSIHFGKLIFIPFLIIPLVLVRPFGIVAIIPIYFYLLERNQIISGYKFDLNLLIGQKNILQSLLFLPGLIAFAIYCIYQKRMTGYYFAFSIAQAGWHKEFMFPLLSFFRSGDFATQFNSYYTIGFILLSIVIWKKVPFSFNLFIWTSLLLPLCSGSVISMHRYISVIFPFTFIIGEWLYFKKYRYFILLVLFSLQILVFYYWLIGNPLSY